MKTTVKTIQCKKGKFTNIGKIGKGYFSSIGCNKLRIKYNDISYDIESKETQHIHFMNPTKIYIKPNIDCEIIVCNEHVLFNVMDKFYKKWNKDYHNTAIA
jgi:hypothetical protein